MQRSRRVPLEAARSPADVRRSRAGLLGRSRASPSVSVGNTPGACGIVRAV